MPEDLIHMGKTAKNKTIKEWPELRDNIHKVRVTRGLITEDEHKVTASPAIKERQFENKLRNYGLLKVEGRDSLYYDPSLDLVMTINVGDDTAERDLDTIANAPQPIARDCSTCAATWAKRHCLSCHFYGSGDIGSTRGTSHHSPIK